MMQDIKALIVVLGLTLPLWFTCRALFASFSRPGDFERRRNAWLVLTVCAFLAPNFWIYALIAGPIIYVAAKRDSNPLALYILLLYAVPDALVPLPAIVVNEIFDVGHKRVLVFALIIPALLRARHLEQMRAEVKLPRRRNAANWLLLAYLMLTVILVIPYDSFTNSMRKALLLYVDIGLVFLAWSRLGPSHEQVRDALAAWVLAGMMMSLIAMFETARGWLLYVPISERWGDPNVFSYLLRDGLLRAQVSVGHSLGLGGWLGTVWTLFLCLQSSWRGRLPRMFVGLVLLGGLLASMARGAWLSALLGTIVFILMNPKGALPAIRALFGFMFVATLFLISPFGERFVAMIPFIGSIDSENVTYRQRLLELSIELIARNPWFGDPFVLSQMESLRQGQGIIDLVNGYLSIALFHGLVALALFLGFLLFCLKSGYSRWRAFKNDNDLESALLGASLISATVGLMFFIATAGVHSVIYMLAGLLCSYSYLSIRKDNGQPVNDPRLPLSKLAR